MKKFSIILTALAMVIAGCNKENAIEQNPVDNQNEGTVVSFTATLPQFTDETKATVDNTAFAWADGDKISIPANNAAGYIVFETKSSYLGTFKATVPSGVSLVAGKAIYPASVSEGTYSTTFASVDAARAGFKMEADYTVGAESLSFEHVSAMIHLTFKYTPKIATQLVVKEGETTIATIALSSPTTTTAIDVPVTPNGSKKYTFELKNTSTVFKQVSKTTTLVAGTYYSTPDIEVYWDINVGLINYIRDSWNLTDGWYLYCNSASLGDKNYELTYLNSSETQTVPDAGENTFYMYSVSVPADITKFKVYWTNGSDTDWYGSDNEDMNKRKAYLYEWGTKKAEYR